MRSILYKGKGTDKKDKNHWYKGCYYHTQDTSYCFSEDNAAHPKNDHHYILFDQMTDWGLPNRKLRADINPDTLCEYTGLFDNNSVRIWEHDIIRLINTYNHPATESWYVVRYRKEAAAFVYTDPKEYMYNYMNGFHDKCVIEVMGNEIENPELLKNIQCLTPEEFEEDMKAKFDEMFGEKKND
ncbi:MAG: YopX family protein [Lachnospiraceae bacterium]|nr:YopX family protein [Lachnospiraceae bacterium]